MSAQSAKKKRLGSRRRAANQNETNTDSDITDSTSVAQCRIPEESTELNPTVSLHEAQREIQPPPSPELLGNRRKLGSSRSNRVQRVSESVTDPHQSPEPTEEVGPARQPERQADVPTACASENPHAGVTNRSEVDLESFTSTSENETHCEGLSNACSFVKAMQEGKEKSDLCHTEEVTVGVAVSELACAVPCETEQPRIDSSSGKETLKGKLPNVCSVTENLSDDDREMFLSSTREITTESINAAGNTAIESSLQQGTISSPKGEMPAQVEQNEHLNVSEDAEARHSDDAVNKVHENEIKFEGVHEIACSSESQTYLAQLKVKNIHDSATNQGISIPISKPDKHSAKEQFEDLVPESDNHVYEDRKPQSSDIGDDNALGQVFEKEGTVHEQDVEPTENQKKPESKLAVANTDDAPISLEESFHSIGHKRKMGSTRKNRGRLHVKDSGAESDQEPAVDVVGNTRDNETQEETEVREKSIETLLKETDKFDMAHIEGVSEQVNVNTQDDTLVSIADLTSLGLQSSLTTGHLEVDQSPFRDTPDEEPPIVCSVTEKGNNEVDEDPEVLTQDGKLPEKDLLSEDMESFFLLEKTTQEDSSRERAGPDCSLQQEVLSPPKEEVRTNEGQDDNSNAPEVTGDDHSEDAVDKLHERDNEPTESQEKPEIDLSFAKVTHDATDNSEIIPRNPMNQTEDTDPYQVKMAVTNTDDAPMSLEESASSLQTPQSGINVPLDPQIQQNAPSFHSIGHKRKMGSTRKNRGRLHVKDSGAESDKEPAVDVVGNIRDNETQKDTDVNLQSISLAVASLLKSEDKDKSSIALEISTEIIPKEHNETDCTAEQAEFSTNDGQKQPVNFPHVTGTSQDSVNLTKIEHKSQEMNVPKEIPTVELFSAPHTLATCNTGLKQVQTAQEVSEQSGTSGPQGTQENHHSDDIVILHGRSTQKRRKMGSTRQTQFNGKHREKRAETQESDTETDARNRGRAETVEELTATGAVDTEEKELKSSFKDTSKALPPEPSASLNEEVVDPVEFVCAADVKHHKGIAAPVTLCEPTKSTGSDEERVGNVDVRQHGALILTEAPVFACLEIAMSAVEGEAAEEHIAARATEPEGGNEGEAAHSTDPEMKNASPCLEPKNRRRKMGSTRKSLRTGTKQEDSQQTQEPSDKVTEIATNVADAETESSSSIVKDEPRVDAADKGGTETTEYSESHKPPAHQTFEDNPAAQGRMSEAEHQVTPSYRSAEPSTPPKDAIMSEPAFGGRRRKMGSNRKSQGPQSHGNQPARVDEIKDTQNERNVRSVREETAIETEELRDESSKVDQSLKKQLPNLSSSQEGDLTRPVSEKTLEPVAAAQRHSAGIQSQGSPQRFSLDDRPDLRSKAYNVMMVGDSSVGKSSFMKRAQSGKFSLDLPASVGMDSCMWTVLVEGKPVVLQLWDTAGQERFHSLTKQTFHKAHAFLLMYDITCSQSFSSVSYWENCIREAASESVTILLVGNKSDGAQRQVKTQEAEILATEYRFEFMECSAATGENVVQCLETMARILSQKDESREDSMVLHKEPQQKTSRCC